MARCNIAFLGLVALLAVADAVVPPYIMVCGRKNPDLNKCVEESVRKLTPKLKDGIPELDVPSLEPLFVEEIALANLNEFRAVATNVKLRGLSNFTVKHLNVDLKNQHFDIELLFPEVFMDSDYDVKAKILVQINEKGPISTVTRDVIAKASLKMQTFERRGRKLLYFPTMTTKITITDYEATFMPGSESNPIAQAVNSVLVSSRQDIIVSMIPSIEKAISGKVLEVSNKIVKHFTYDELFPDTD